MRTVFLSYHDTDLAIAERLVDTFTNHGIPVCHEKVRAGEEWPKTIAEIIAKHDFFVLMWSTATKESDFVELEWNIALALEKTIVVYVIDNTPLPGPLTSAKIIRQIDTKTMLAAFQNAEMRKAGLLDQVTTKEASKILQQTKAIFGLEALVERMKVKNRDDVFVIGAGERRITLYSQQVRALNLVYWLWKRKRNSQDLTKRHIMIVGAGAAGLTVAAAVACLGARVTILEANEKPMAFQRGCRTRLLHPYYYEWPEDFCWKMSAGLPLLDWDEGSAGHVAETICKQFDVIRLATHPRIKLIDSVSSISIEPLAHTQDKPVIRWKEMGISKQSDHDITELVLAVGFGVEETVPGLPLLSYWRDDPLEQAAFPGVLREGAEHRQLISGTGDGGLVDVLRASLWDFDHATFFSSFAAISRGSALEKIVLDKDKELWRKRQGEEDVSSDLDSFYRELNREDFEDAGTLGKIDNLLRAHRRANYKVLWLYDAPSYWRLDSMRLLRLLVSRLMNLEGTPVEPKQGRMLKVEVIDPARYDSFNYSVSILGPDKKEEPLRVHGVTVRHGPERALERIRSVWKQLNPEQRGVRLFTDYLSNEPPTPTKYWEHDDHSDKNFKSLLGSAYKYCKDQLSDRPPELCVKLAPGPNPIHAEKIYYRLIVHLACAPADVQRVAYDLHSPRERRDGDQCELRKERSVVLEPSSPGQNGEDKELFKKLVHTESDFTVRVRLDNGQEFIDRLACGLCRHYQSHSGDPKVKPEAKNAVRQLLREHTCLGRDGASIAHCLLSDHKDQQQ